MSAALGLTEPGACNRGHTKKHASLHPCPQAPRCRGSLRSSSTSSSTSTPRHLAAAAATSALAHVVVLCGYSSNSSARPAISAATKQQRCTVRRISTRAIMAATAGAAGAAAAAGKRRAVVWLRNDLRVLDNPLLHEAAQLSAGRKVDEVGRGSAWVGGVCPFLNRS